MFSMFPRRVYIIWSTLWWKSTSTGFIHKSMSLGGFEIVLFFEIICFSQDFHLCFPNKENNEMNIGRYNITRISLKIFIFVIFCPNNNLSNVEKIRRIFCFDLLHVTVLCLFVTSGFNEYGGGGGGCWEAGLINISIFLLNTTLLLLLFEPFCCIMGSNKNLHLFSARLIIGEIKLISGFIGICVPIDCLGCSFIVRAP